MTTIQMPQLGETIVEGTILKWLKQEGDQVARDEPLFEMSTDKVDTEVPSPVAGTVTKILVEEGATVPVGTVVMEVGDGARRAGDGDAAEPSAAAETAAAQEPVERTRRRRGPEEPPTPPPPPAAPTPSRPLPRARRRCRTEGRARRSCPARAAARRRAPARPRRSPGPGRAAGSRRRT